MQSQHMYSSKYLYRLFVNHTRNHSALCVLTPVDQNQLHHCFQQSELQNLFSCIVQQCISIIYRCMFSLHILVFRRQYFFLYYMHRCLVAIKWGNKERKTNLFMIYIIYKINKYLAALSLILRVPDSYTILIVFMQ